MADFRITVIVDPSNATRGTRRVGKELQSLERSADRLKGLFAQALTFVGLAGTISQLVQLADTFTNIQNRLGLVTSSTAELNVVTDELFKIAQKTRSSFESTAQLFARTALATKELGLSQRETLEFTESLNKAIGLSGASSIEAQAGLIQLSQGLASGRLNGDELRSVLEQIPLVADVIAEKLGVTRGELRKLGEEGKITAKEIIVAFSDAREELAERFATTVPTIGQSFVILRNALIRIIGDLDTASGATGVLAQGVIELSNNLDVLFRIIGAVSTALIINFTKRALGGAIIGVRTLTAAIAANPFGAIAVAITAAVSTLVAFSDQITVSSDGLVTLQDAAKAVFEFISSNVGPIAETLLNNFNSAISGVVTSFGQLGITFDDVLQITIAFTNRLVGLFVGTGQSIGVIFNEIGKGVDAVLGSELINDLSKLWQDFANFLIDIFNDFIKLAADALDFIGVAINEIGNLTGNVVSDAGGSRIVDEFSRIGTEAKDAFLEGYSRDFVGELTSAVSPAIESISNRAREISQARIQAEQARRREEEARAGLDIKPDPVNRPSADFERLLAQLEKQAELLQLSNSERRVQEQLLKVEKSLRRELDGGSERSRIEDVIRLTQSLKDQAEVLNTIRGPFDEYNRKVQAARELLQKGQIDVNEFNKAIGETELGGKLQNLQKELDGPVENEFSNEIGALQEELNQRQELIQQALDARVISEQEANRLIVESQKQASDAIRDIESARFRSQLQLGQTTFSALASITRGFVDEQSSTYRNLFAISKGFAIADSAVQIANALAKAANTPFPANLGAIATVASQTASIVSTIQGTQFAGAFQNGGEFTVGGSGGTDSQMVSFQATPGERVTVQTPQQQRTSDNQNATGGQGAQNNIKIVNVLDPNMLEDFLTSTQGEQVLVNTIQRNSSAINSVLQES